MEIIIIISCAHIISLRPKVNMCINIRSQRILCQALGRVPLAIFDV